jgi:hypothetical protein
MKTISPERKALYYLGIAISVLGMGVFLSVFVSGAMHFGDFSNFEAQSRSEITRAIAGMVLVVVGQIVRGIGARGAAGAGLLLDSEKAREDLEPWARMGGGLVKDAIDETGLKASLGSGLPFDEKLRRLEALKKDGLVSEEEYRLKRKEILEEKA